MSESAAGDPRQKGIRMTALEQLQDVIEVAAARVGPAVVGLGQGWGSGSGVVIAPGQVLTVAHNLRHDEVTVGFADGRSERARLAASDPDVDVAVLACETADVEPVTWHPNAQAPAIGRAVLALANPGGRGLRVTPGFVSSQAMSFRGPRGRPIAGAIEHTAPLPRGSSGGPLVDTSGQLLGINSVRVDGGLILAVPADAAMHERVQALGRGEAPSRARLGVAIAPPRVARRLRRAVGLPEREGVLVRGVEEGGPAHEAGVLRGDLLVAANGRALDRIDALYESLDATGGQGRLEFTVVRGTDERLVTVQF